MWLRLWGQYNLEVRIVDDGFHQILEYAVGTECIYFIHMYTLLEPPFIIPIYIDHSVARRLHPV